MKTKCYTHKLTLTLMGIAVACGSQSTLVNAQKEVARAKQPPIGGPNFYIGGALIISTIEKPEGVSWPGTAPQGMYQRLNYPANEATPNDDQLIVNAMLHVDRGIIGLLTQNIPATVFKAVFPAVLNQQQTPIGNLLVVPPSGALTNATEEDREYLGLAFFDRSKNSPPPVVISFSGQNQYLTLKEKGDYRVWNHFVAGGPTNNIDGTIQDPPPGNPQFVKEALVGPTPFELKNRAWVRIMVPATPIPIAVSILLPVIPRIPIPNPDPSTYAEEDEDGRINPYGNDLISEVRTQSTPSRLIGFEHRAASRIGPLLRPAENSFIWPHVPPSFYSEIRILGGTSRTGVQFSYRGSPWNELDQLNRPRWNWPAHHWYKMDEATYRLFLKKVNPIVPSPWRDAAGVMGKGFLFLGRDRPGAAP